MTNNFKKQIITITGFPGSGKSSTARGVAEKLGYEHFSSGDLFRRMAAARGLSVEEINFAAEKQTEIDREVDEWLTRLGKEKNNFVVDSRTAFHWIPESYKVFLDLDPVISAQRVFRNIRKDGRESQSASSAAEVLEKTMKRRESEQRRYQTLYRIDIADKSQFDLVVDTAVNDLQTVIGIVIAQYQKWLS